MVGAAGSGGEAGGAPTPGPGGAKPEGAYARFTVHGAEEREALWLGGPQFVGGSVQSWLRFSADPGAGDDSDHIDVDVFGYGGPGAYAAYTCAGPCQPPPMSFDVFYHPMGTKGPIFHNARASKPCWLELAEPTAGVLEGAWSCAGMPNMIVPGEHVDMQGDFRCLSCW